MTHTITAKYLGNTNFVASSANASATIAVSQAQTNTVITATTLSGSVAATNTVYGQAITFVATVTAITGGGAPVGPVFFADVEYGAPVGTVNLTATGPNTATATLVVSSLAVGDHHIAATFGNTTNYGASTTAPSNNWEVLVAQDATTTTVTSSAPISVVSQAVRFSATVAPLAPGGGGNPPTGSVAFYLDGSATPFATVALNKGVAVTPAVSNLTASVAPDHGVLPARRRPELYRQRQHRLAVHADGPDADAHQPPGPADHQQCRPPTRSSRSR